MTYEFVNILFSEYLNKVNMNSTNGKYATTASTNFTSNKNTKTSNFYSLETHDKFKSKNVLKLQIIIINLFIEKLHRRKWFKTR